MEQLTKLQKKVLTYLKMSTKENNFQPSVQEMAEYFGVTTTAIAMRLQAIERKGFIKMTGKSRAIEILK